jgi:hypothetical protein
LSIVPAVYDIANTILNAARVRLNDRLDQLDALSGKLLENTQPWTQQAFNNAYRKLQEFLTAKGFERFIDDRVIQAFPPLATIDPSAEVWMNWAQCFDGLNLHNAPVLPDNFIQPRKLWERPASAGGAFLEMDRQMNGLPSVPKLDYMLSWEWRGDKLYLQGARVATDLRIRYAAYLPDIADDPANQLNWFEQPVPIMRCQDALADYIVREVLIAREDSDGAAAMQASAESAAEKIWMRDPLQPMAILKSSEWGKMGDERTPGQ